MTWWLTVHTPDRVYCWPVGEGPPADDLIDAARVRTGFPAHDGWVTDGSGYALLVTAEPHRTLLARAVVGDTDDLRQVDPVLIRAHRDQRAVHARADRVRAAKAALAGLDPAELAEVLAGRTDVTLNL